MQMLSDRHGVGMKENEIKDLIITRNIENIEVNNNVDIDDKNNKNENENEIENSNDNIQNNVNNSTQKIKYTPENNTKITPYFCGFARTYEQLEIISDFLASTTWDGELGGARGKRLELCVLMELNMETKARTVGKYGFLFFYFIILFYFFMYSSQVHRYSDTETSRSHRRPCPIFQHLLAKLIYKCSYIHSSFSYLLWTHSLFNLANKCWNMGQQYLCISVSV